MTEQLADTKYYEELLKMPIPGSIEDDERLQKQLDGYEIIKGFCSKVYKGHQININITSNNNIHLRMNVPLDTRKFNKKYEPITLDFNNLESFVFLLEALKHAVSEFNINTQEVVNSITGGREEKNILYDNKIISDVTY
ncbi:MAG: hypothetical protein MUF45_00240 [Spirosomaceae bacterium]|nr:hypothetical protein [Spirosomataceae bacterium]